MWNLLSRYQKRAGAYQFPFTASRSLAAQMLSTKIRSTIIFSYFEVIAKEQGIKSMTEEEYAMKFAMLIILDEKKVAGMDQYLENYKYIMEQYSRLLKTHPSMLVPEDYGEKNDEESRKAAKVLEEVCKVGNIGLVLRQSSLDRSKLFSLFVEAIYRALILVHFYAPEGELLSMILKETYFGFKEKSDIQLCKIMHVSRATYYRRKQQALMYAGYFFYEAVLPDMEGKI